MKPSLRSPPLRDFRVLGIDPGTHRLGYGLVELRGGELRAIESGVVAGGPGDLPRRLGKLFRELEAVLRRLRPDRIAVERVFVAKDPRATITLGEGRGIALLAAGRVTSEIVEITPAEVKKSVAGHGAATKAQVQRMVQLRLGLAKPPVPIDASDALAIAMCAALRMSKGSAVLKSCGREVGKSGSRAGRRSGLPGSRTSGLQDSVSAGLIPADILRRAFAKRR